MKNTIDINNIINYLDKIKIFNQEQNNTFNNILKKLQEINSNYISDNTNKLIKIQNELYYKFNIIKINNYDNEIVLFKNINKTTDTVKKVNTIFNNIK